eukprot:53230_1
MSDSKLITLTTEQINEFITNGVLVVPNVLTCNEINDSLDSLHKSLLKYEINTNNLIETAYNLNKLSTTGGAGGIIDLFYEPFRLNLATHPQIFNIITQLWSNTYGKYNNNKNNNNKNNNNIIEKINKLIQFIDNNNESKSNSELINTLYKHPFGSFDTHSGYVYMNRVCFRVSDTISNYHSKGLKKKRKLQRCLAPHLDCCPHDIFGLNRNNLNIANMKRWRPIQIFVALTDNHCKNTGGFECVKGFHRKFNKYFKNKTSVSKTDNDLKDTICVGDFCRLLPKEDKDILCKYKHIEYDAGSLILFDWRIPHANARYNKSNKTRIVVYTGLLPNVELNRNYCKQQLKCYYNKTVPPDFWGKENYSNSNKDSEKQSDRDLMLEIQCDEGYKWSVLGQKLMGIKHW